MSTRARFDVCAAVITQRQRRAKTRISTLPFSAEFTLNGRGGAIPFSIAQARSPQARKTAGPRQGEKVHGRDGSRGPWRDRAGSRGTEGILLGWGYFASECWAAKKGLAFFADSV